MRGKQNGEFVYTHGTRITPADAGKTSGFSFPFDVYKDHPRRCGENRYVPDRRQRGIGSPPQMRGKRRKRQFVPVEPGITPADAGKTNAKYVT